MPNGTDFLRFLDFLRDPVFVVEPKGRIAVANHAARALVGADATGRSLSEFVVGDPDELHRHLARCSGTAAPIPGALELRGPEGKRRRVQSHGALLAPAADGHPARIVLLCRSQGLEEFSILRRSIAELNREIRLRQRAVIALEEAVRHRETLLAELHHRVKNNTQMLLGMLTIARRNAEGPELTTFLDAMRTRLIAIGAAQQFMYQLERVEGVCASSFIPALCRAISDSWPPQAVLEATAEELELPNDIAVPLALIVNELTTNALKHGLRYGPGRVGVDLRHQEGELMLTVWDSGTGAWTEPPPRSGRSGIGLVRALCRQIGGTVEFVRGEGTCCLVRIPFAPRNRR